MVTADMLTCLLLAMGLPPPRRPYQPGASTPGTLLAGVTQKGATLIMSPANRAYLDMQYDPETPLGLFWAGRIEVRDLSFAFKIPEYDEPIDAAKVAQRVIVRPGYKTIVYTHAAFTVRARVESGRPSVTLQEESPLNPD